MVASSYFVTEILRQAEGITFCRARRVSDDRQVLLKVLDPRRSEPAMLDRLKHDYAISKELAEVSPVLKVEALDTHRGLPTLVFEHFEGTSLDQRAGTQMTISEFLALAIRIATAVEEIHAHEILHRNLKPESFLVDPASGEVKVMDFGIASRLPREHQAIVPARLIQGSLPYMSPEQTERTNRVSDNRSDLYSLGIMFFELLTGELPFHARDPLEWVHFHVARAPVSPSSIRAEIPEMLSRVVLKLLAKTPEDRYQSAQGLKHDLERCQTGEVKTFPLGERDGSGRLRIPQKLFGREQELTRLLAEFDLLIENGTPRLVLVSGYSGIGKTSLVSELYVPIIRNRGFFISGKFDRFKHDTPYSTLVHAFRDLVFEILAESDERIESRKKELKIALGINGQLITDVIPEVELLIGKQPPVVELPPAEARNRFQLVFRQFVDVFAKKESPLTLFLDDLQWADFASLALLKELIARAGTSYLLVVGAYRSNEVGPAHPLTLTLNDARREQVPVTDITLTPLSQESLAELLGETLRRAPEEVEELAELVHEKTAGNPFYATQFIKILNEEHLIHYDPVEGTWHWNMDRIRDLSYTDNVPGLVVGKLKRLPSDTQELLKTAACLGNAGALDILAIAYGEPEERTASDLKEAIRGGVVIAPKGSYRFLHDRLQEAVYSLIPPEARPAAHLKVGRSLLSRLPSEALDERLFEVVNQLNRGLPLIDEPSEKNVLSQLNFKAGKKAKHSIAYDSASRYFAQATDLLSADAWERNYEDVLQLYLESSECEHLIGNFERADELFKLTLAHARTRLDRMKVYILRLRLYQIAGKYREGLESTAEAAHLFGITLPESDEEIGPAVQKELEEVAVNMKGRKIAELVDAPVATDPDLRAIIGLLSAATPYAYIARPTLFPLIVLKTLNLSLKHGNTEASCFTYNAYGTMLISVFGDIRSGYEFSELALELNEKFGDRRLKGVLLYLHAHYVNFWAKPFSANVPLLAKVLPACLEVGELVYASYHVSSLVGQALERGETLKEVTRIAVQSAAFAAQIHGHLVYVGIRIQQQLLGELRTGVKAAKGSENELFFDQEEAEQQFARAKFSSATGVCHTFSQIIAFTYARYEEALAEAELVTPALGGILATPFEATHHFFYGLTLAALSAEQPHRRAEFEPLLQEKLAKLKIWAKNSPENYQNRLHLLSAELDRLAGRELEAERHYSQAIRSARENGFPQYEALACELASAFHRTRGFDIIADAYLREARLAYQRWGATGKVRQLERIHPSLFDQSSTTPSSTLVFPEKNLDLLSVVKASQKISGEIILEDLSCALLQIALEQSGGQKGYLILPHGAEELSIEAQATVDEEGVHSTVLKTQPADLGVLIPLSVMQRVRRARERAVLSATGEATPLHADPYLLQAKPKSLLCLPILRQNELVGILYLENRDVPFGFSSDRLTALELLAAQAAISLDNANLYTNLREENVQRREAQEELRRSLQAREDFIMIASHELRTPITPLKLSLQLLKKLIQRLPTENQTLAGDLARTFTNTEKQVERLTNLVEVLLDISRISSGRLVLDLEEVDLTRLVQDVLDRYYLRIKNAGYKLTYQPEEPVIARCDRSRIEQVFANLLTNAIKYGAKKPIDVKVTQEPGKVRLIVTDQGIGIPKEAHSRIFERFEREAPVTHYEGLGLGLYISREIVNAHGGTISVESAPGHGTTFTVVLPA